MADEDDEGEEEQQAFTLGVRNHSIRCSILYSLRRPYAINRSNDSIDHQNYGQNRGAVRVTIHNIGMSWHIATFKFKKPIFICNILLLHFLYAENRHKCDSGD